MKKLLFIFSVFTILSFSLPTATFAATAVPTAQEKVNTAATHVEEAVESAAAEHATEDTGVIGLFGLNWKLFLAQLVNFAIILFILWKFVFNPVIKGMQDRTKKIEDSLNDSDRIEKEKAEFETWKQREMNKARGEAGAIISEAKNTAEATRQKILDQSKQEQTELIEKTKQQLESEKQKVINEAKSEIANLVVMSTEKLLKAKLDSKADAKLIAESLKGIE
jgi:F-type H+-transporting ATPase subunit b